MWLVFLCSFKNNMKLLQQAYETASMNSKLKIIAKSFNSKDTVSRVLRNFFISKGNRTYVWYCKLPVVSKSQFALRRRKPSLEMVGVVFVSQYT